MLFLKVLVILELLQLSNEQIGLILINFEIPERIKK
jgi:hypothetical protein